MNNKKIVAKGIIVATVLANTPVDSLANTIEEYKVENMQDKEKKIIQEMVLKSFLLK